MGIQSKKYKKKYDVGLFANDWVRTRKITLLANTMFFLPGRRRGFALHHGPRLPQSSSVIGTN
jgi:hypothetical protein